VRHVVGLPIGLVGEHSGCHARLYGSFLLIDTWLVVTILTTFFVLLSGRRTYLLLLNLERELFISASVSKRVY
jgi:hypothetical protein